jgi:hypothetical protein
MATLEELLAEKQRRSTPVPTAQQSDSIDLDVLLAEKSRRSNQPSESVDEFGSKVVNLGPRRTQMFNVLGEQREYFINESGDPVEPVEPVPETLTPEQREERARKRAVAIRGGRAYPELTGSDIGGMNFFEEQAIAFKMLLATTPEEQGRIAQASIPGSELRTLPDGTTSIEFTDNDGKRVAAVINRPGFSAQDASTALAEVIKFLPAARATRFVSSILSKMFASGIGSATVQAASEKAQELAGGEFNAEQIPIAGAAGAFGGAADGFAELLPFRTPRPQAIPRPPVIAAEEAALGRTGSVLDMPQPSQSAQQTKELATSLRKASEGGMGSKRALEVLAEGVAPDAKTIEAAKRLGIEEYLQPDQVSTSQIYREISQAVKSVPGSAARQQELQNLERIARRADDLVTEIGGTTDLSRLEARIGANMRDIQADLLNDAETYFKGLRELIPSKEPAPANSLISFLNQRADELGGVEYLQPAEKDLLKRMAPKNGNPPTYALLDDTRRSLTRGRIKKEGTFKDAPSGLLKKLEKELLKDQKLVAERMGQLEMFNLARAAVATRKAIEDDMKSLFGRNLDQSLIQKLITGTKDLAKGDVTKFIKVIKAIPEENRQEFVASALNIAFGKNARRGNMSFSQYADFYEGLLRNKQAYAALQNNLPQEARKQLSDLYRVSNGIRKASRERIATGRLQVIADEIKGSDSLISNIYQVAKKAIPAEAITSSLGIPGIGSTAAITSALTKGKPNVMKAADDLITSPEFIQAVNEQTPSAFRKFTNSGVFKRFQKEAGNPSELADPASWIQSIFISAARASTEQPERPATLPDLNIK